MILPDDPTMAVVPRLLDDYFHAVANNYRPDVKAAHTALSQIMYRCSAAYIALARREQAGDIPK